MMECHVSKNVRHKIFHELAARFQRNVFDVLSPWYVQKYKLFTGRYAALLKPLGNPRQQTPKK